MLTITSKRLGEIANVHFQYPCVIISPVEIISLIENGTLSFHHTYKLSVLRGRDGKEMVTLKNIHITISLFREFCEYLIKLPEAIALYKRGRTFSLENLPEQTIFMLSQTNHLINIQKAGIHFPPLVLNVLASFRSSVPLQQFYFSTNPSNDEQQLGEKYFIEFLKTKLHT